ncbi:MAG: lipoate--protein ligase family protein [Chloroflexota bacterium]
MTELTEATALAMAEASQTWVRERLHGLEVVISPPFSVAENLALDEEMTARATPEDRSVLRLWWGGTPAVVAGNSENLDVVADLDACARLGVPVLRRKTGGGTVLQTADVLNYSLTAPGAKLLDVQVVFALGARLLVAALAAFGLTAEMRGISDVVVGDRKISGNAQARRWGGVLLHGTLLRDLDLALLEACLRHPPREPAYRRGRSHRDFLTTLIDQGVSATRLEIQATVAAAAFAMAREG